MVKRFANFTNLYITVNSYCTRDYINYIHLVITRLFRFIKADNLLH